MEASTVAELLQEYVENINKLSTKKGTDRLHNLIEYLIENVSKLDTFDKIDYLYRVADTYPLTKENEPQLYDIVKNISDGYRWILYNDYYDISKLKVSGKDDDRYDNISDVLLIESQINQLLEEYQLTENYMDYVFEIRRIISVYIDRSREKRYLTLQDLAECLQEITDYENKVDKDRLKLLLMYTLTMGYTIPMAQDYKCRRQEGWVERPYSLPVSLRRKQD